MKSLIQNSLVLGENPNYRSKHVYNDRQKPQSRSFAFFSLEISCPILPKKSIKKMLEKRSGEGFPLVKNPEEESGLAGKKEYFFAMQGNAAAANKDNFAPYEARQESFGFGVSFYLIFERSVLKREKSIAKALFFCYHKGRKRGSRMMKIQESMENYLETIHVLNLRTGFVRSVDIATELGFSKPSISNAIKKLRADGYVQIEDKGRVVLTDKGLEIAERTYERHCIISQMLIRIGVSEKTALEDACRIEHFISQETFDCMKKHYMQEIKRDRQA